ncbi:MAG: hypothetical protein KF861_15130, partial [Planctomycetaceae bacterium]|nr:hypothetical protein [Planctomycetaceae bacterium]
MPPSAEAYRTRITDLDDDVGRSSLDLREDLPADSDEPSDPSSVAYPVPGSPELLFRDDVPAAQVFRFPPPVTPHGPRSDPVFNP